MSVSFVYQYLIPQNQIIPFKRINQRVQENPDLPKPGTSSMTFCFLTYARNEVGRLAFVDFSEARSHRSAENPHLISTPSRSGVSPQILKKNLRYQRVK